MINKYENLLNCTEHLRDNLDKIIEAFVAYYGEDQRAEIEEKFSRAVVLAYRDPSSTSILLNKIAKLNSEDIFNDIMEVAPSSWSKEDLFDNYDFTLENSFPINKFAKFYEEYLLGKEGRFEAYRKDAIEGISSAIKGFNEKDYDEIAESRTIPERFQKIPSYYQERILYYTDLSNPEKFFERSFDSIKDLLTKIDPNVTLETISDVLNSDRAKELIIYTKLLPEAKKEYSERMEKYQPYYDQIDKQRKLETKLENDYYLKFIEDNLDLLNEEDLESLKQFKEDPNKRYLLTKNTISLLGRNLRSNCLLDAFSKESDTILNNPKASSWQKDSILKDRIAYYNSKGIDLGNVYDAYEKSDEVKKIWPSLERIDKFIESRNQFRNSYNNAYYNNLPDHMKMREEIEKHNLLNKDDGFNASLYSGSVNCPTFVCPNVVENENGYGLFSLVAINCSNESIPIDHHIIHEFNHLYELSLTKVDDNSFDALCGWDSCHENIVRYKEVETDTINTTKNIRGYELFNEIINELIAQEIYVKMLDNNDYIFNNNETAEVKGTTSYEFTFFLVRDFFNEYRDEIIASRNHGNIGIIWDKVGKENFDALNHLFEVYNKHFEGFKIMRILQDLAMQKETEEVKVYRGLVEARDKILEQMRTYSLEHSNEARTI